MPKSPINSKIYKGQRSKIHCRVPHPLERGMKGLDHGIGHSLLLLYDVKAPNGQKSNEFKDLGHYPSNASWDRPRADIEQVHTAKKSFTFR